MKLSYLLIVLMLIVIQGVYVVSATAAMPVIGPDAKLIPDEQVTYFVTPDGDDANDGKSRSKGFATMQKAVDQVLPGETVLVCKGVYREGFWIHKEGRDDAWITIAAEPGVEIRGSDIRKDWVREPGEKSIWSVECPELNSKWQTPETNVTERLEQAFVDGRLMQQVNQYETLRPSNRFYVNDEKKKLYVCLTDGRDPNQAQVEVTMRSWAIQVGNHPNRNTWNELDYADKYKASYVRISGFRIRNISTFMRQGAIQLRGRVHHIIIENCDVQYANTLGISINGQKLDGDNIRIHHVTIRNNISSNNGWTGISGSNFDDVIVENNIIDGNNYRGISVWREGGGVKLLLCDRVVMRWNVLRNNDNHTLWLDYAGVDCLIENNLVYRAMAGGILNEVTPCPYMSILEDGTLNTISSPPLAVVKRYKMNGTTIRNNVIIGTRPPSGVGITVSGSTRTKVYNNIISDCEGSGIHIGGSPEREGTNGSHLNQAYSNLIHACFTNASIDPDSVSKQGLYFGNQYRENLYINQKTEKSFLIGGVLSDVQTFEKINGNAKVYVTEEQVFVDPKHWNFALAKPQHAEKIGFTTTDICMDWSQYYVEPPREQSTRHQRSNLIYHPLDIDQHFNRGLTDDVEGDGKGGWTDQGPNDMSQLPTGKQTIDSVVFKLGTQEKGAVLFETSMVKPGPFIKQIEVAVGQKYDELYFLYTAAWCGKGPLATINIQYADGSTHTQPINIGEHLYDWHNDPNWQQHDSLNQNDAYVAWQGPNPKVSRVAIYYLRLVNPNPERVIRSVVVKRDTTNLKPAFLLLAVTAAQNTLNLQVPDRTRVGYVSFDGNAEIVDAFGQSHEPVDAHGKSMDPGKYLTGVKGTGILPNHTITLPVPSGIAGSKQGTLSMWLCSDDLQTEKMQTEFTKKNYRRDMTAFEITSKGKEWTPWTISVNASGDRFSKLELRTVASGATMKCDVTQTMIPGQWFNVMLTWAPDELSPKQMQFRLYVNGVEKDRKNINTLEVHCNDQMQLGCAKNGGNKWWGSIDELAIYNYRFSEQEISSAANR